MRAVAALGNAVQNLRLLLRCPGSPLRRAQERDIGGRTLASLCPDERLDASIPYSEAGARHACSVAAGSESDAICGA